MSADEKYPEHAKLRALDGKNQTCGDFISWLGHRGIELATRHHHNEECYRDGSADVPVKICGMANDELYPSPFNIRKLLAEFFEIDEEKLEAEKRQMLEDLRGAIKS